MKRRKRQPQAAASGRFMPTSTDNPFEIYRIAQQHHTLDTCWPPPTFPRYGIIRKGIWYLRNPAAPRPTATAGEPYTTKNHYTRAINIIYAATHNIPPSGPHPCGIDGINVYYHISLRNPHHCCLGCLNPLHYIARRMIMINQMVAYKTIEACLKDPELVVRFPLMSYKDADKCRRRMWAHRNNFLKEYPNYEEAVKKLLFERRSADNQYRLTISTVGYLHMEDEEFLRSIGINPTPQIDLTSPTTATLANVEEEAAAEEIDMAKLQQSMMDDIMKGIAGEPDPTDENNT